MAELNYTKGRKWIYEEELGANMSRIVDTGNDKIVCGLPNPIPCDAETDKRELAEMRSDASLIAAAPAMYEALKGIKRDLEIILNNPDHWESYNALLAALAAAEGSK